MSRHSLEEIAARRLISVLARHGVANARTLEQKISDSGPYNQRIDPHVLTTVRNLLVKDSRILKRIRHNAAWFHLPETPQKTITSRLDQQLLIYKRLQHGDTGPRIGQCLEIAIYRALLRQNNLEYLGGFLNLSDHDDSKLYSKEEPPTSLSGRRLTGNQRLDFLVRHPEAGWGGIEAKNVREWQYPAREEITKLLDKAVSLDCVPILICRRFPFVTFKVLSTCGVVLHQTYNQYLPETDRELADKAGDKTLLGYHDIRVGNLPDTRLIRFIGTNLPNVLPRSREKFEYYKDLLGDFGSRAIAYEEFAARVRRRSEDTDEDNDWESRDPHS